MKKNSGLDGKRFTAKVGEPVEEVEFDIFRKEIETEDQAEENIEYEEGKQDA